MIEISDMKGVRKTTMLISVVTLLLLYFSEEIVYINILGIVRIDDISQSKLLTTLLGVNIFFLLRYMQITLFVTPPKLNYKTLLINYLIKPWKVECDVYDSRDARREIVSKGGREIYQIYRNAKEEISQEAILIEDIYEDKVFVAKDGAKMTLFVDNKKQLSLYILGTHSLTVFGRRLILEYYFYLIKSPFIFEIILPIFLSALSISHIIFSLGEL